MYNFLADVVAVVHASYILFVVGGQILILSGWVAGWVWTRHMVFRTLHLAAIGFVVIEAWAGVLCPLTAIENRLRQTAGNNPYESSFIGYWIDRLIYYSAPEWVFILVYSIFALVVLATFIFYPPIRTKH